jgi:hypothetical protein
MISEMNSWFLIVQTYTKQVYFTSTKFMFQRELPGCQSNYFCGNRAYAKRINFTVLNPGIKITIQIAMSLNINIKEALLARCIALKEETEVNIMAAMEDAQQSANDYGAPRDRYDSFRAQMMRKRDMLAQQLAAIKEDIRNLRQLKPGLVATKVEHGALVKLNTQTLYIASGIGKIDLDGVAYYVVSPVVPLVTAMQNLKAGDTFSFRGTTMQILEIC